MLVCSLLFQDFFQPYGTVAFVEFPRDTTDVSVYVYVCVCVCVFMHTIFKPLYYCIFVFNSICNARYVFLHVTVTENLYGAKKMAAKKKFILCKNVADF